MGRPRKAPTVQVRLAKFADAELGVLVDELYEAVNMKASSVDVLGALVVAGRSLPPTVMRELLALYVAREREEAAKLDV